MSSASSVSIQKFAHIENSSTGWEFIQSLTKSSRDFRKLGDDAEQVYVHPLGKNSASSMSSKSLEMCTESLGSETGSDIDSNVDDYSSISFAKKSYDRRNPAKTQEFPKKTKHDASFPPPLTSMSGNEFVQVKTRREEGRLVIKVTSVTSYPPCFQAERCNGRLRLSLLNNGHRKHGDEREENDEGVEEENVDDPVKDFDKNDNEEGFRGCFWGENIEENGGKIECEMGGGEWSSCCRCNGDGNGSKRLHDLRVCVAIS